MKLRSDPLSRSVASWTRCSPLPASSPIDRSATEGLATPSTRSANSAPMRANCARLRPVESVVAPMSRSTNGPFAVVIGQSVAHQSHADIDGGVTLPADRRCRLLVHVDDLTGVDDPDVSWRGAVGDRAANELLVADEDDLLVEVLTGVEQ